MSKKIIYRPYYDGASVAHNLSVKITPTDDFPRPRWYDRLIEPLLLLGAFVCFFLAVLSFGVAAGVIR